MGHSDATVPIMASDKRTKLVIGIDFGTTFSGYSSILVNTN